MGCNGGRELMLSELEGFSRGPAEPYRYHGNSPLIVCNICPLISAFVPRIANARRSPVGVEQYFDFRRRHALPRC